VNNLHEELSGRAPGPTAMPDFFSPETISLCREFARDAEEYAARTTEPAVREAFSRIAQHWTQLAGLTEAADANVIPPLTERRKSPRKKSLLFGKLAFASGAESLDCTICDISLSGARISLPQAQTVPADLYLIVMRSGIAHRSEVRWRTGSQLGVRFLNSISLDGDTSEVEFLKALWRSGSATSPADTNTAPSRTGYFETSYKGYRIVAVSEGAGYVVYTHNLDCAPRGDSGVGKRITNCSYATIDLALTAAKKWCNAALSGWPETD
jgi:PilZ domain